MPKAATMPKPVPSNLDRISPRLEQRVGKISSSARCHKYPRTLEKDYRLTSKVLGTGYAGSVLLATSRNRFGPEEQTVAVKTFKLKGLKSHQKEQLLSEIEIFLCMDHPHVARLLDVYETTEKINVVMECVAGGELFDRIIKDKRFAEPGAAHAMRQMLLAVHYMHSHGIVHRDIKLENFLYDIKGSDHLKMIDFGFSKFCDRNARMKTCCGTPAYVAPEVLKKNYTCQCDLWSLGVIGFILLSGKMPFGGSSQEKLTAIKQGRLSFKEAQWKHISKVGKEFIKALLHIDPKERLTSKAALEHSWLTSNCSQFTKLKIDSSVVDSIVSWINTPKLQRACLSMVSWSLTNKQHALVRDYFVELDKDHDGLIKWAEIKDAIAKNKIQATDDKKREVGEILRNTPEMRITYSDFLAAMTYGHIDLDEATVRSAFLKFDTDESTRITTHNFTRMVGYSFEGEDVEALVDQAGVVGADGKIGYSDFAKLSGVKANVKDSKSQVIYKRPRIQHQAWSFSACAIREDEEETCNISSGTDGVSFLQALCCSRKTKDKDKEAWSLSACVIREDEEEPENHTQAPCCSLM